MRISLSVFLALVIVCFSFSMAFGDAAEIKNRMKNRLPAILYFKSRGQIIENEQGYLECNKDSEDGYCSNIVRMENKDRKTVYEAIAYKTKKSTAMVGRRRAIEIQKKDQEYGPIKPLPSYINGIPGHIYVSIEAKCKKKWAGDYRMQKYCIDDQIEAYIDLNR